MSRGAFIVLEGLDRSGKSTQCRRLVDQLKQQGTPVQFQPYPDRKEPQTGPQIVEFLKNAKNPYEQAESIHDLFSKNRQLLDSKVRHELSAGTTVIADRYSFSGIAYSAAKHHPDLPFQVACSSELGLCKPDLVIYLRADPDATSARRGYGDEALERVEFQREVQQQMDRLINSQFWEVVDALQPIEKVFEAVWCLVKGKLDSGLGAICGFQRSDFNSKD